MSQTQAFSHQLKQIPNFLLFIVKTGQSRTRTSQISLAKDLIILPSTIPRHFCASESQRIIKLQIINEHLWGNTTAR